MKKKVPSYVKESPDQRRDRVRLSAKQTTKVKDSKKSYKRTKSWDID